MGLCDQTAQRLKAERVTFTSRSYTQVRDLYLTAFPPEEREPWHVVLSLSYQSCVDFSAYYNEEDDFCGLSYCVFNDTLLYVFFLAVDDTMRSRGYGSAILQHVCNKYTGRNVALEIEPVWEHEANYQQRVRRLQFYERNGFHDTGILMCDQNVEYTVLCTGESFSVQEFIDMMTTYSFGRLYIKEAGSKVGETA